MEYGRRGLEKGSPGLQELRTHGFILLIEVIDIAVQNFDEELHGHRSVHAGVCDAKSALEAFENAFAVSVEL